MEEGGEDVRPLKIPRRSTVLMRRARSEVPSGKPEITSLMSASVLEMKVGRMVRGYLRSLVTSFARVHLAGSEPTVMPI